MKHKDKVTSPTIRSISQTRLLQRQKKMSDIIRTTLPISRLYVHWTNHLKLNDPKNIKWESIGYVIQKKKTDEDMIRIIYKIKVGVEIATIWLALPLIFKKLCCFCCTVVYECDKRERQFWPIRYLRRKKSIMFLLSVHRNVGLMPDFVKARDKYSEGFEFL